VWREESATRVPCESPEEILITIKRELKRFLADDSGLTTTEYAVAGALISIVLAVTFASLGSQIGILINVVTTLISP
jgi:Flp pilus assembly pilin Flp